MSYKELYDKDMREALFSYFEENESKIRFIEEHNMGKSRADIMMICENEIVGFELKSDKDSLVRLKRQIPDYDRFFDRNYIVVGEHFVDKIASHVPEHWGIIKVFEDNGEIKAIEVRKALKNEKHVIKNQMLFLWREELVRIIRRHKLGGVSAKNKKKLCDMIYNGLDIDAVRHEMIYELMEREYPVFYILKYSIDDLHIFDENKTRKATNGIEKLMISIITNGKEIIYCGCNEFADKYIENNDISLHIEIKKQLDEYFNGKRKIFDLPLEKQRMSALTRKVYGVSYDIPYGEVMTYSQVAKEIENPRKYRAVGVACTRNPFKIIVPTHRIVGTDGKPTGVMKDLLLKKILLATERKYQENKK